MKIISRVVFIIYIVALSIACQGCLYGLGSTVPESYFNTKWTYNESKAAIKAGLLPPSKWKESFGACDSSTKSARQSPIDINHEEVPLSTGGVLPLVFGKDQCPITLRNIGATLSAMPTDPSTCKASFTTASGTVYKFYEAHLHWHSLYNHRGTEHKLDGQAEAVEAHIVHYDSKFASMDDAVEDANVGNIAIVAIRYTVAPTGENATEAIALDSFIGNTYLNLRYMDLNASQNGDPMNPYDLIGNALPRVNLPMYHYNGSLTTPRCDSIASWYIVQQTVMLSKSQVRQLRFFSHVNRSESEHPKLGFNNDANIRPVVPLNGRDIIAWPVIIEPNMSSDSAPEDTSDSEGMEQWKIIVIVVASVFGAILIGATIGIIWYKVSQRSKYKAINTSA